jgi:hypothetical protein
MPPELQQQIDAAWETYVATLPDRSELSVYQLARSKELFTAGWVAANTQAEGRETRKENHE